MRSELNVLFLAAEAAPWVKIGGLGDFAGSLPSALKGLSLHRRDESAAAWPKIDVRLVIPFHGAIQRQHYPLRSLGSFQIPFNGGMTGAEALEIEWEGFPVYLIAGEFIQPDAPVYSSDAASDGLKFTFFSMASLELARQLDWRPQIIHANDWHTAPAVYGMKTLNQEDSFFKDTATVLGVHNLPYLGRGSGSALAKFGLPPVSDSRLPSWARDVPMPLGLLSADHIVAVSPTYAREILTPADGAGLHKFLRSRSDSITGILNGLDDKTWDPEHDEYLSTCFTHSSLKTRSENKLVLQSLFGLEQERRRPLFAIVSRLDYQKGVDLVPEALGILMSSPSFKDNLWQMIILGAGDRELETMVRKIESDFPNQVRAAIRFDAALSHRLYAGADMLLIPSRYEPCGLTQMIAMRYGCVPVASATGGLRDTIHDYDLSSESTGFLFQHPSPGSLADAIKRALLVYGDQRRWKGLQRRGMKRDFSWSRSARQYLELYLSLLH